ncbi:conserved hypothetical protein [Trichormus variabilis ATCC 29413]|uniref:Uncharacterized protein n=2 Tax=Anabaena variabilis TaxID=264691 RepID=Q3M8A3_TRIV2|nr:MULTISPECIES: hypothetical protein [Nostocaceae]ABA22783.1 conserved hypothetical protein [Trichormus variabilis ATCC 29413]MBC1216106.1 hypothetical protein [Trichormus variabilis ARAD]MBC1256145.1 hypothetical protein [Trichormus variabilis V5]MBC1270215.1 hypothetical protein [Trichormus variabilis FSR]MBC1304168.1 hypothetical protein [Trichormus variabilis N2B]
MSGKLKLFLILLLSIFVTAGAGVYLHQYQDHTLIVDNSSSTPQQLSVVKNSQEVLHDPERIQYKNIPLSGINSPLQGSDPKTLALNFLDDFTVAGGKRKVEIAYPQHNQALVTVTQVSKSKDTSGEIKYRLEMNSLGRSLFASSPPVWQIVWVGSQISCRNGNQPLGNLTQRCD